jgi:hypothetical protein
MNHCVSDKDWDEYIEGGPPGAARDRVEAHLINCRRCWDAYEQRLHVTRVLREAGAEVRKTIQASSERVELGRRRVMARVEAAEAGAVWPTHPRIRERLDDITSLMTLLCGAQMADRALAVAAHGSPARSLGRVTPETWEPFLDRLTSLARFVGGETGADLIWESGQIQ